MKPSLLVVPLLLTGIVHAQGTDLLDPELRDLLHEELSGELAKEHVIAITRHHRIQGSRGYRDSGAYVLEELRGFGFDEDCAWVESFPSDGRVHYQTWQSPSGWDIESGELRMLEPYEERIVGYPEIAMSVITYSNAGEATSELVYVGPGTKPEHYEGKDVAGKFALATGYGGAVHRLAVLEHGARGVVCFLDDERAAEYPDMLAYTGMWPKPHELENTTFGFNLTNRQGSKLRSLLEEGPVVVRGSVQGIGLEPYEMDVITAVIRGTETPEEELVFSAHLDHPKESANDNASGSAALLDIARTLRKLIDGGQLPAPKRTIRFLWVPEFFGTMAYVDAHPEMRGPLLGGQTLANVNMDMVGENLELLHCRLQITRTPESIPSLLGDVMAEMASMVDRLGVRTPRGSLSAFNYRITPYAAGSDHMMFIDRKVPGVMMWHAPDYTHHTSEDTPDKVDPAELERCELLGTGAVWFLANLDEEGAMNLAWLVASEAAARLVHDGDRAQRLLALADENSVAEAWREAHSMVKISELQRIAEVRSVLQFCHTSNVEALVNRHSQMLEYQSKAVRSSIAEAVRARIAEIPQLRGADEGDTRIPVRLTRGPLALDLPARDLPPERAAWYAASDYPLSGHRGFELVNFIDGRRTVTSIRDHLSAEFGPVPLKAVARYLDDLVSVGVVEWGEAPPK